MRRESTKRAIGISLHKITDCVRVGDSNEPFITPGKTKNKKREKRVIDEFVKCQVRDVIYQFCMDRKYYIFISQIAKSLAWFHFH